MAIRLSPAAKRSKFRLANKTKNFRKPHNNGWELTPEDLSKIEHLAGLGMSHQELAYTLDISVATLDRRRQKHEEIDVAIARGKAKARAIVKNAFFEEARKGSFPHGKFFLNNWKDVSATELSGPDGSPLAVEAVEMTDEARTARIASLLNAARQAQAKDKS